MEKTKEATEKHGVKKRLLLTPHLITLKAVEWRRKICGEHREQMRKTEIH